MKEGNILFTVIQQWTYGKEPLRYREETHCCHYKDILYAPSHRQDSTYHSLCYTSCGELEWEIPQRNPHSNPERMFKVDISTISTNYQLTDLDSQEWLRCVNPGQRGWTITYKHEKLTTFDLLHIVARKPSSFPV